MLLDTAVVSRFAWYASGFATAKFAVLALSLLWLIGFGAVYRKKAGTVAESVFPVNPLLVEAEQAGLLLMLDGFGFGPEITLPQIIEPGISGRV